MQMSDSKITSVSFVSFLKIIQTLGQHPSPSSPPLTPSLPPPFTPVPPHLPPSLPLLLTPTLFPPLPPPLPPSLTPRPRPQHVSHVHMCLRRLRRVSTQPVAAQVGEMVWMLTFL